MDKSNSVSKKPKWATVLFIVLLFFIIVSGLTYTGLRIWFKSEITQLCENAMLQYRGDKIEALIAVLESDSQSLHDKNNAIWALGKLRDKRALPVLKSLVTGAPCDHNRFVCQRELEKAINNLEGTSIDILTFK